LCDGLKGIWWWAVFKDHKTGKWYKVCCSDGINGGKGRYDPEIARREGPEIGTKIGNQSLGTFADLFKDLKLA